MTNLSTSNKKNKIITPENSLFFLPIFFGSLIFILLLSVVFRPLMNKLNKEESKIEILEDKISYIPQYKILVNEISNLTSRANNQQIRLIELISDKNELKTILSEINKICINNSLEIINIIPQPIVKLSNSTVENDKNESASGTEDPFLIKSIEKHIFEVTLIGNYNNLVDFLKELELLQTIVITDDIKIVKANNDKSDDSINLEMSFNLTTYANINKETNSRLNNI
tara:strand:- start:2318 stop:2998 length:681 start_codon:yes stop_codon:yes gene_type:complete